jgi:hypothetical protein
LRLMTTSRLATTAMAAKTQNAMSTPLIERASDKAAASGDSPRRQWHRKEGRPHRPERPRRLPDWVLADEVNLPTPQPHARLE